MTTYCDVAPDHPVHGPYHDKEYGFPVRDESVLFERLTLEIFQAGLSWLIVLKKRPGFTIAFENFDVDQVAAFDDHDIARLREDASIIRNRLKIEATIYNAKAIQEIRRSHDSFASWLADHHPLTKDEWCKLFKKTFKFTGGEIVGEFLMSIGYLQGAHQENCPIFKKIATKNPAWMKAQVKGTRAA
ncbi:MAG: DNA-3-methyladenine glycosylase I [Rhodospirillaceae bacterium]|nr:DNA-3-methyladenine glycosylase I [Rhodospirillaceae bacterium]MBT7954195.1 DNA-3-methyladenine glycosylase I [Rhodospirillaceae bacterium]